MLKLVTTTERETQETFDVLDDYVAALKEVMPDLAGFAIVPFDKHGSVLCNVHVAETSPFHKFMLPDMCKTAILDEVLE